MSQNGGSNEFRNYPDVSAMAAHQHALFVGGTTSIHGGTSFSAPLWAGFVALSNQAAQNAGLAPIGAGNPAIYSIGDTNIFSGADNVYKKTFHDIADNVLNSQRGNEPLGVPEDGFPAVAGYDLATGWGTPSCKLLNQLAQHNPAVPAPSGSFSDATLSRVLTVTVNPDNPLVIDGSMPIALSAQCAVQDGATVHSTGSACLFNPNDDLAVSDEGIFSDLFFGSRVNSVLVGVDMTCSLLRNTDGNLTPLMAFALRETMSSFINKDCSGTALQSIDSPINFGDPTRPHQLSQDESGIVQVSGFLPNTPTLGEGNVPNADPGDIELTGGILVTNEQNCGGIPTLTTLSDSANCGACGSACPSAQSCNMGVCTP
jgi:hypothetical protein